MDSILAFPCRPRIALVGCGGAGGRALNCASVPPRGLTKIVVDAGCRNQDEAFHIPVTTEYIEDPNVGRQLSATFAHYDLVFVFAGLGGGVGSHFTPIVAEQARRSGALVVAVVFMPLYFEGASRRRASDLSLKQLLCAADAVHTTENSILFSSTNKNLPFDQVLVELTNTAVRPFMNLVVALGQAFPGSLGLTDMKSVLKNAGRIVAATGRGYGANGEIEALYDTLSNLSLANVEASRVAQCLLNVAEGDYAWNDTWLAEEGCRYRNFLKIIKGSIHPEADISFRVSSESSLGEEFEVTMIGSLQGGEYDIPR